MRLKAYDNALYFSLTNWIYNRTNPAFDQVKFTFLDNKFGKISETIGEYDEN